MVNIEQITIAVKIAGEEYIRKKGIKEVIDIHGMLDVNRSMCEEILHSTEQYLIKTIDDPKVLNDSLTWLKIHMKLDEQYLQQETIREYMTTFNQLN